MTDYLAKVTKWLGYSIALVVIIAATLVSVGRLLTPYLNQHKPDFENWASQLLNSPVRIDQVYITWNGYVPQLTLNKVTILDKNTKKPSFDIREIKLNIKVFDSLFNQKPVLSYIKLTGMDLTIHSKKTGEWNIQGFGDIAVTDDILGGVHEANEIVSWIFTQPALVLSDIHVTFYTRAGIKKTIMLDALSLVNSSQKHILSGKGTLVQDIPTGVELALNWSGNSFDLDQISANLYLYLEGISLTQWFKQQTWNNLQIKEGLGSAKLWVTFVKGKVDEVQTQLQLYQLNLYSTLTHQTQIISRLNGHVGWKRDGENQIVAGDDILIDLPNHLWPMTSFSLTLPLHEEVPKAIPNQENESNDIKLLLMPDSKFDKLGLDNQVTTMHPAKTPDYFSLKASYVDLADVHHFAATIGALSEELQNELNVLKPKGEVSSLQIDFHDAIQLENNTFSGAFSNVILNEWKTYPGIKGYTGIIQWDGKTGKVSFNTKNIKLLYHLFYVQPITLGEISGQIYFKKDKKDLWIINSNNFSVMNQTFDAYSSFSAEVSTTESPKIDLIGNFRVKKAENIAHYFPIKISDPELSRWIVQAFRAGQFTSGKVVLKGQLKDFPFVKNNGNFSVTANAKDLDFGFALGWPVMKHVDGTVQFVGSKMLMEVDSGILMNIPIKNIQGEIPYIGPNAPQKLHLVGNIEADLAQAMLVIQKSPLRGKLNKQTSGVQLTGPMQLKLDLTIPLKKPEETAMVGDIKVAEAMLSLPAWGLHLTQLKGELQFTEDTIKTNNVTGIMWNEPISLNVIKQQDKKYSNVLMKGKISTATMYSWTKNTNFSSLISGEMDYQADLRIAPNEKSVLTITTDLKGISLNLPTNLGKTSNEVTPSTIIAELTPNKPLAIQWIYGTKLTAATIIKTTKSGAELYSAALHLGDKEQAKFQTQPGIIISGQFDVFDWDVWKKYFKDLSFSSSSTTSSTSMIPELFRGIDLRSNKIVGLFQPLTNVHIVLNKDPNNYTFKIDSTEMSGLITLPLKANQGPIKANFNHLHLIPSTNTTETLDPKNIPAIMFAGENVIVRDKKLGNVKFDLTPTNTGLTIDRLYVESDLFNFNARGAWLSKNNKMETQLSGKLTTKNVAEFLSYWGSPTVNPVGSNGSATFDLHWADAPYKPILAAMTGEIDLSLSSGSIVNLDTATTAKMGFGRILNLLSLESISRALTLNFSDLTEKGYSFDSMKGRFILKDGSAYTEDTTINGSVAQIEMSGRLGLAAKDYDINVIVTPHITGSIPVVAALAVNPIAGIAAWAVEKIAGKAVSSATTHRYKITGTWDKPVWVEK